MRVARARRVVSCSYVLAGLCCGGVAWGAPILEYRFNGTGLTAASSGSNATVLEFFNAGNASADLHSASGLGVGGDLPGHADFGIDRAFDNRGAAGMGNAAGGASSGARHSADLDAIDALTSWTVSGWFRTEVDTEFKGYATLYSNYDTNNGFRLTAEGGTGNSVQSYEDSASVVRNGVGYDDVDTWVFFAVTYDGSEASNNLRFYRGYRNDAEASGGVAAVTLVGSFNVSAGVMNEESSPLYLGNRPSDRARPFQGLLDNVRIYGGKESAQDNSGALTLTDLENLRIGDVLIPEPASLGGLGLAGLLLLRRRSPGTARTGTASAVA